MIQLETLWAKSTPFQSIITHGTISGIIAQILTDEFLCTGTREQLMRGLNLLPEQMRPFIGYFVSLHDIGKIHYSFQAKSSEMKETIKALGLQEATVDGSFRHEAESGKALRRIWGGYDKRTVITLSEILSSHHQGKKQNLIQQPPQKNWEQLQVKFEKEMRIRFMAENLFPKIQKEDSSVVSALLMGLVILSDWIASGDLFSEADSWENMEETVREKAEMFMRTSGLYQHSHIYGKRFCQVWPNIPSGNERELQIKTEALFNNSANRYSLILIEAPMGEGKTEAGVYAAIQMAQQWKKNGFYVALPTSATANQMVTRMRQLLSAHHQEENVKLMHAMAWMVDEESDSIKEFYTEEDSFAHNWLLPMRRGLLAPYAVGTVDQAMMAAMFIKYGVLRLLGLSGKALIIDEIHAYDTYMQNIMERLLEWCKALEIPVVLLSATLPPEKKRKLLEIYTSEDIPEVYPAVTAIDQTGKIYVKQIVKVAKQQTYNIERFSALHNSERIARYAVERVKNGGCLCVMLNTVAQAQSVYNEIHKLNFPGELTLFHSRFTAQRRDEIEKKCVRDFGKNISFRPKQAILVATQVVEQSLDVDFDYFISAAAPIDLLIQRMGRQFRHEETPRPSGANIPEFTVLTPEDGKFNEDAFVYPECLLQQTLHLLENKNTIRVPEDLAQLVSDGYDSSKVMPEELERWMEHLIDDSMKGAMADQYKLFPPCKRFRPLDANTLVFDDLEQQSYLSAQTRLSEPTVRIALVEKSLYDRLKPYFRDGKLAVHNREIAKKILQQSVSIRKKVYDRIINNSNIYEITGEMLIAGVKILEENNPCFRDDPELGVIWKEEQHEV